MFVFDLRSGVQEGEVSRSGHSYSVAVMPFSQSGFLGMSVTASLFL